MQDNTTRQHWENIYYTKDTTSDVSWYQENPRISVELILSTGVDKEANIIDGGGGDSKLVDKLLQKNFKNQFVLDISGKAIEKARTRLKDKAKLVTWVESDILEFRTDTCFAVWHDRATFHFLTKRQDIVHDVKIADKLVKPNGYLIVSTFSTNGPKKCSGLDITQYSENSIKVTFKRNFKHIKSLEEIHTTPFNTKQRFLWTIFKRQAWLNQRHHEKI